MSQWLQVSRIALCMSKVKVSESVSQSVTRSPIELFWTAKNDKYEVWRIVDQVENGDGDERIHIDDILG